MLEEALCAQRRLDLWTPLRRLQTAPGVISGRPHLQPRPLNLDHDLGAVRQPRPVHLRCRHSDRCQLSVTSTTSAKHHEGKHLVHVKIRQDTSAGTGVRDMASPPHAAAQDSLSVHLPSALKP